MATGLLIPIASSQAVSVLHFLAKELLSLQYSEGVHFVKGDHMSSAELKKEAADFCQEDYSAPSLYIQGVSGGLGKYQLKYSSTVLDANWLVAPNGENLYRLDIICKQWGDFPIPASDGYKFNFKYNSPNPDKKQASPWYSKKYLSDNQWKVNYFTNSSFMSSTLGADGKIFISRWLPRTELPMPVIRVLSIDYGVNDVDHLLPLVLLGISGEQFTSISKHGWNKWTIEFNNGIYTIFRPYTSIPVFDWPLNVGQDQIFSKIYEVRILQAGYRYSSRVGKFTVPSIGGDMELTNVHRTLEGALVDIYCEEEC